MALDLPEYAIQAIDISYGDAEERFNYEVYEIKSVSGVADEKAKYLQLKRVATFDDAERAENYCDIYRGKKLEVT